MSKWTKFATSFYQNKKRQNKNYKFSQALTDASEVYKKGGGDDKKGGNPQVGGEGETTTAAINRINEIIIDNLTKVQVNTLIANLEEELTSNDESKYEFADGTNVSDVKQTIDKKLNELRDKLAQLEVPVGTPGEEGPGTGAEGPGTEGPGTGTGAEVPGPGTGAEGPGPGTGAEGPGPGPGTVVAEGGKKAKKSAKKGKKSAKKGKKSAKKGGKKARKSAKKRKC